MTLSACALAFALSLRAASTALRAIFLCFAIFFRPSAPRSRWVLSGWGVGGVSGAGCAGMEASTGFVAVARSLRRLGRGLLGKPCGAGRGELGLLLALIPSRRLFPIALPFTRP